ncbi:hypothetical protein SK128_015434 [Halocaridina rubra]|uniref:C2H2-type domain-containing protein n=1 Tax=Halocaridina rubra TaxID=373956 RepID=A0AAN8WFF3_HALRR
MDFEVLSDGQNLAFMCSVCSKTFSYKIDLDSHAVVHHEEKTFMCDICNKAFSSRRGLERHSVVHTGERPFVCCICCKAFSFKHTLKQHYLTHSGERPYECDVCNKTFAKRANLIRHTAIHSRAKLYFCKLCNKSFAHKEYLKKHLLTHTGQKPFVCGICDKKFTVKDNMRRHFRLHEIEGPHIYNCSSCLKFFSEECLTKLDNPDESEETIYSCYKCNHLSGSLDRNPCYVAGKEGSVSDCNDVENMSRSSDSEENLNAVYFIENVYIKEECEESMQEDDAANLENSGSTAKRLSSLKEEHSHDGDEIHSDSPKEDKNKGEKD